MARPLNIVALLSILLLTACAQSIRRDAPLARPARASIKAYVIEGRVSVKYIKEAKQASLNWRHDGDRDDIELSGPLGQQVARLSRDAAGARLDTSAHETFTAANWDALAERVLGVMLPLDSITRWVTANLPAQAPVERDTAGRPLRARVEGWQIDYRAYESDLPDALPTLIQMHREDVDVRLKVDQWQID